MNKTIGKPQACIKAQCGAMCCQAQAEFSNGNPEKCLWFKYDREGWAKNG